MSFPENITTVPITGRLLAGTVDGPRPTVEKQAVRARLLLEFVPEVAKIPAPGAIGTPTTFYRAGLPQPVRGVIDSEGYLCTPDPDNAQIPMFRGVRLIATDDPAMSVKDWTWRVKVSTLEGQQVEEYSIAVPASAAENGLDLTNLAPVPSTPGYGIPQAEAAAAQAAQNSDAAAESADRAEAQVIAVAEAAIASGAVVGDDLVLTRNNGEKVVAGNVRGPEGPAGTSVAIKGTVATAAELPGTGNTLADGWITSDDGHLHVWGGSSFTDVGAVRGPQGEAGPKGDTGTAAAITSATATKLAAGANPTVTVGGTDAERSFAFGIPAGATGPQGPAGPNTVPTDDAIAGNLAAEGTKTKAAARTLIAGEVATNGSATNKAIRDLTPADILVNAYRKKIVANLAYDHADSAAARNLWGSLYPQTFVIDKQADEIFVLSAGPKIVSVYKFSTGAYKRVFCLNSAGSPEGAVIRYESGRRYLYTVHEPGNLGKWDITTLPANLSTPGPVSVQTGLDLQNSFDYRNGFWTTASKTPDAGNRSILNRGKFIRYNESFQPVGMVEVPSILAGGNSGGDWAAARVPKFQGFAEGPGVFALSIGGGWNTSTAETPYHYQGIRVFSGNGQLLVDSLITASGMREKLIPVLGMNVGMIENEGIQYTDGKFYSLTCLTGSGSGMALTGGILIFEEFSNAHDAIDFRDVAAPWTVQDVALSQTRNHPVDIANRMRNRVTWEVLDNLSKIFDYMVNIGQTRFTFYSSEITVFDLDGSAIPAGNYVEIVNANNGVMFVTVKGWGEQVTRATYNGTAWVKGNTRPTWRALSPASGLVNLGGSDNTRWTVSNGLVTVELGIKPTSGQFTSGTTVLLNSPLPTEIRPDGNRNFLATSQGGATMRLLIDSAGVVQLLGVTASTHNYVVGQFHYRP